MRLAAAPIAYRHVVFPDGAADSGRPINLAPLIPTVRAAAASDDDLTADEHECASWLFARAGLELSDYRIETVKRRIPACTRSFRAESLNEVCAAVRYQPELLQKAIDALVIGVTSFFRDPDIYLALNNVVLPKLLARNAPPRIWSAACSDGAELYSVAMLLAARDPAYPFSLLGTDCRPEAIARARAGSYDPTVVRSVPPELLAKWFTFDGMTWTVGSSLRSRCAWRLGNVLSTPEPGGWDLILCRNMAIYLQPSAVDRLWSQLAERLRPGGYLVLGKAERPYGAMGLTAVGPCIYRRDRS